MKIEKIRWQDTLDLRHRVLWPSKKPDFCKVSGDENARHYGAYAAEQLVGVASTFIDEQSVRLRKFAVDTNYQGKGIGSELLHCIIINEKAEGSQVLWCDARESAIDFYARFGFSQEGPVFRKFDIPYVKMFLNLNL